ncbi:putative gp19 [Paraburkholderia xenovorans LB400]|uniref:Uncharacterized protein n=1 Tax=Paraburkholderia xenovorans (strain LB400) TaxID=266265 RepID=Q141Q5_PARXL|nr:hypothetical protein [Paraburkholderia xenovorans]ABE29934.1 hypothetical protein Bxe_A3045 [Paraburkholderia xenovorans LB400]AIP32235.1 putative gp19 [Paraburkholderia xenovorans LB400]
MNDILKKSKWLAVKLIAAFTLVLVASNAGAQFTPGQILTASQLNAALAVKTNNASAAITGGTITGLSSPLPVASGGTGATSLAALFTPSNLAVQAANTVLANVTSTSASPTAFVMPSCSTANSALQYTSGTGFTCITNSALTTATLAQFAATTSAQLAGVISDETGSGSLVFGTNPSISGATTTGGSINNTPIGATTANTGKFTTLQTTGAYTPSSTAGIVGTTTNDSANAGSIGERFDPTAGSTSITSATPTNIISQSLTAGDWDCEGYVYVLMGSGATGTIFVAGIGTVSATLPAAPNITQTSLSIPPSGAMSFPVWASFQLASTTTVYLVGYATFSGGTATTQGRLHCRRPR